jgi:hypothetical protein
MNPPIEQEWAERPPVMPDPFAVDDDPRRTVRVLESNEDVQRAMADFHAPRRPVVEDQPRLPFDPAFARRQARENAYSAAEDCQRSLERSLDCLAIDRPEVAAEYEKLVGHVADYVGRMKALSERDG